MSSLCYNFEKLLINSISKQSWSKHNSALNLFKLFCNKYNHSHNLPIQLETMRAFTTWALTEKSLQPTTVKSYISSLKIIHELSNLPYVDFAKDKCIVLLFKGAENMFTNNKPARFAMNIHLLKIIGHRIAESNWCDFSKQVVWAACTLCFFTACRMGEIVSNNESSWDPKKTLLWENVHFYQDYLLIFLPFTKTTGFKGAVIDIFPIKNSPCCPFKAMEKLLSLAESETCFDKKKPVFAFKSGKCLTTKKLNNILQELLQDFCDESGKVTCHSFRAAIPSVIASHPDKSKISEILEWGRWSSNCYKFYTRHEKLKRKLLFEKIVSLLE